MFGEALRLVRTFHQLNQAELADALSISRSYLSEIESGKKVPSLELLQRYAEYFRMPLSSLIVFSETTGADAPGSKAKAFLTGKALEILQWVERKADLKKAS